VLRLFPERAFPERVLPEQSQGGGIEGFVTVVLRSHSVFRGVSKAKSANGGSILSSS
jgi:hypothetical protein